MSTGLELLKLEHIGLAYGSVNALKQIDFTLGASEIHAIVGEHGAGKSSLGLIISGILKPHSGRILFDGQAYRSLTLKTAVKLGIEMVHQHALSLNQHFTVAENFSLTNMPLYKLMRQKKLVNAAQAFFERYAIELDPSTPVEALNLSDQVFVDILKHLYANPKLLILDEVLEQLSPTALKTVVRILADLKRAGLAVLFITHRIDDIYHFADKVSIMKNGEMLITDYVKNIDKINLIRLTYTQIAGTDKIDNLNQEFYQFLKYNEAILRSLPVNLIVTDNAQRIKMVNDSCKQFFRLQETSYFNVALERLFTSHNTDVLSLLNNALALPEGQTFYHIPLRVNDLNTVANIKTFPIYDGTFRIGQIIILEDITEYDQLQKQVMFSEKLASVGLLAAGVAHEINNPLEIIYNYLSYIKYNFQGQQLHEAIDNVHAEIASIANIVSNLHSFSDNKQSLSEELEINELIRNMLNLLKHNAQYKHIKIHFDPSQGELCIRANKNEIKQVILNLFKNSFEAMPSGGEIFIKTTPITENEIQWVQLTFRDTGPGISDANPNNIFLPFYSTKKGQEQNLGLGLSVSYGIIKKYNGTIAVKNIEHSGCQFVIQLPLHASYRPN